MITCTPANPICTHGRGLNVRPCGNAIPRNAVGGFGSYPYFCTRERGHTGAHLACGTLEHNYGAWMDIEASVVETKALPSTTSE